MQCLMRARNIDSRRPSDLSIRKWDLHKLPILGTYHSSKKQNLERARQDQLTHTESNFSVTVDIHSVPRTKDNHQVLSYPRFPMRDFKDPVLDVNNPSAPEQSLYDSLCADEDTINSIEQETRNQAESEKWKKERTYRFTASQFHTTSHH